MEAGGERECRKLQSILGKPSNDADVPTYVLDEVDRWNYPGTTDGWEAAGFVRVENILPQTYHLALIVKGDTTTVTQIPLNADQTAEIPISLKSGEEATLVVTGTARFTRMPAAYEIEIK